MNEPRAHRAYICLSHSPFMKLPGNEDAGPLYRAAVDDTRRFIADFNPELVVMFAPDHMNLLTEIRPSFTGILTGRTLAEFGVPELPLGISPLAEVVYQRVVDAGVDLAVGEDVQVDHGLGLSLTQLFDEPSAVPLLPIIVNAIGYPLPQVSRCAVLGSAFRDALAEHDQRILFIGTGGLSHNPPFPAPAPGAKRLLPAERERHLKTALDYIDPAWDKGILSAMENGDASWTDSILQEDIDRRGGGANEIRTWAAAWAAAEYAPAAMTAYESVPEWITGMGVAYGVDRQG